MVTRTAERLGRFLGRERFVVPEYDAILRAGHELRHLAAIFLKTRAKKRHAYLTAARASSDVADPRINIPMPDILVPVRTAAAAPAPGPDITHTLLVRGIAITIQ